MTTETTKPVYYYECRGGIKLAPAHKALYGLTTYVDHIMLSPSNVSGHCANCQYYPKMADPNCFEVVDNDESQNTPNLDTDYFCDFDRKQMLVED